MIFRESFESLWQTLQEDNVDGHGRYERETERERESKRKRGGTPNADV